MNSWSIGKTVKHLVAVAVLFFVLFFLVDLLYLSLSPLGRTPESLADEFSIEDAWHDISHGKEEEPEPSFEPLSYWQNSLGLGSLLTRTVTISATAASLSFDFDLWIPREHPVARDITRGTVGPEFAKVAFGEIWLNIGALREEEYASPSWSLSPETGSLHVRFHASRSTQDYLPQIIDIELSRVPLSVLPDHDQVVVQLSDQRLISFQPQPDAATPEVAYLRRTAPESISEVQLRLEPMTVTEKSPSPAPERESRQEFLLRLSRLLDIVLLSNILYSLVEVLPLLIFWYLVRQRGREAPPYAVSLAGAVASLLLFHFTLYFLGGSTGFDAPFFRTLSESAGLVAQVPLALGQGASYVMPALLGVLLPALLFQRAASKSPPSEYPALQLIQGVAALLLLAGIVMPVVYVASSCYNCTLGWSLTHPPMWALMIFAASLLALLIWPLLSALYRCLALEPPRPGVTLSVTVLIAAMGGLEAAMHRLPITESAVWLPFSIGLGASLLLALVSVVRPQIRQAVTEPTLPRWRRWLLLLFLVLLVVPMRALVSTPRQFGDRSDVASLAFRLDNLIPYLWLAGMLWLLYRNGRSGQRIDAFTHTVGILAAATLMFNPTGRWLYIPVTFLIGCFLLSRFIRPAEYWRELQPLFRRVFSQRLALLDQIVDLGTARSAYRDLRKNLRARLASGDMTFEEYDSQLEARKKELDKLHQKAVVEGRPVREVALTFGPYPSAWQNGLHGARFALLLASPWILLFLQDFFSDPLSSQAYPLWEFLVALVIVTCQWAVFGFLFGYFYPYLWGRSGLHKGFGFFFVSVIPSLPLMALFNTTPEAWQASLFWALQVFVLCILLGLLAFDYAILRRGYWDWQILFEVHGLRSVGISVSSILVAVGAAVTTLMTTQTTSLIALALRFLFPQVPFDLPAP
jgi:hypothetical protein